MRLGIDISSWQHPNSEPIDFDQVKAAGYDWCAVKFTEANNYVNPFGLDNAIGAKTAGLEVVAYHFARPAESDAASQSAWFRRLCDASRVLDGFAVDLEDGRQLGLSALNEWMREFVSLTPLNFVYWNRDYRDALRTVGGPWGLREWVAWPGQHEQADGATVIQYAQAAVPGVPALCDVNNVFYDRGTLAPVAPQTAEQVVSHVLVADRVFSGADAATPVAQHVVFALGAAGWDLSDHHP